MASGGNFDEAIGFSGESDGSTARNASNLARPITNRPGDPGFVAQVQWASGGGNTENDTAQVPRSGAEHNYQFARVGYCVRRLTPTECEKLQGFTTTIDRVIFSACLDHQKNSASVEVLCRKSQSNALPVGVEGNIEHAPYAGSTLWNDQENLGSLVAAHVRMSCAPKVVRILSQGKCLWYANGVEKPFSYHLPIQIENIVQGLAVALRGWGQIAAFGRAEPQKNTTGFTLHVNGKWPAVTFGPESKEAASDAENTQRENTKSTILNRGPKTNDSRLTETTWLCSVLNAMTSFIPAETPKLDGFGFCLDVETDYTLVPYHGKPAKDGPRYKALGNSMAVPCMAWIGKRIQMVEDMTKQR